MVDENQEDGFLLAMDWPDTVLSDFTRLFCQNLGCELGILVLPLQHGASTMFRAVGHFNLDEDLQGQLASVHVEPQKELLFQDAHAFGGLFWAGHREPLGPFERQLQQACHLESVVCGIFETPGGEWGMVYAGCKQPMTPSDQQQQLGVKVLKILELGLTVEDLKCLPLMEQKALGGFLQSTHELVTFVKDGLWVTVNPAFQHTLGYTEAELQGHFVVELLDGNEDAVAAFQHVLSGQFSSRMPFRFLHKDGSKRRIEWIGHPDAEGLVLLLGQDVSAMAQDPTGPGNNS